MDASGPATSVAVNHEIKCHSTDGFRSLMALASMCALVISFLVSPTGHAEDAPQTKFVRQSFSVDYNSWFQELLIKNGTSTYVMQGLLYGLGLNYHFATYYQRMGWALEAGLINGFGVAGRSSSQTEYYANRVPLQFLRGGGRIFTRINSRFDLGGTIDFIYGSTGWPTNKNQTVLPQAERSVGFFVDSHWIVTPNWEVIQGVGAYSRSKSMAWRLGASYSF